MSSYTNDNDYNDDEEAEIHTPRFRNWTNQEIELLINLLDEHKASLYSSEAQAASFLIRRAVWDEIANVVNSTFDTNYNWKQCRKKSENLRRSFILANSKRWITLKNGKRRAVEPTVPFYNELVPLMKYIVSNKPTSSEVTLETLEDESLMEDDVGFDNETTAGVTDFIKGTDRSKQSNGKWQNMEEFIKGEPQNAENNSDEDNDNDDDGDDEDKDKEDDDNNSTASTTTHSIPKITKTFSFASMNRRLSGRIKKPTEKLKSSNLLLSNSKSKYLGSSSSGYQRHNKTSPIVEIPKLKITATNELKAAARNSYTPFAGPASAKKRFMNSLRNEENHHGVGGTSSSPTSAPVPAPPEAGTIQQVLIEEIQGVRQEIRGVNRNLEKMIDVHNRLNDNIERFLTAMRVRLQ